MYYNVLKVPPLLQYHVTWLNALLLARSLVAACVLTVCNVCVCKLETLLHQFEVLFDR